MGCAKVQPSLSPSLLVALLLHLCGAAVLASAAEDCNGTAATPLELGEAAPKVTSSLRHQEGQRTSLWSLKLPSKDVSILLTPENASDTASTSIFALTGSGACRLIAENQGPSGDLLLLRKSAARFLNASEIFLRVSCRPLCAYHVSLLAGGDDTTTPWQEVALGESTVSVAYHGQPQRFRLDCREECSGSGRQLVVSAWPRDATSGRSLALHVRKDEEPVASTKDQMPTTSGWFSGEVVSTNASAGIYYITVIRRHGRGPLPFVLSARQPETLERLPLGKPVFGAVDRDRMAFYRFEVLDPRDQIEVYLTTLEGDADLAMSHGMVNSHPRLAVSQWQARKRGDGVLFVMPDDPQRRLHPTGWFHVGVFGFRRTAFSIVAVLAKDIRGSKGQEVTKWSELWLGAPQLLSASPRRPAAFKFFSRLATPRLSLQIEPIRGAQPDTCMVLCGPDRTSCMPSPPSSSASCTAATSGEGGEREAVASNLCPLCWYAIFVASPRGHSRFRISLAAEGRAQPLVAGEPFRGHVDAKDEAVVLVYHLSQATAAEHANSSLRVTLTPLYGDPVFVVHRDSQDGPLLFDSKKKGRNGFELQLPAVGARSFAGTYFFVVRAESRHAKFSVQVFWEPQGAAARWQALGPAAGPGSLAGLGLPTLDQGEAQRGQLLDGEPVIYLFSPVNASSTTDLLASVTSLGEERCRIYAVLLRPGESPMSDTRLALARFASSPRSAARWRSGRGEQAMVIRRKELPKGSSSLLFAIAVAPAAGAGNEPGSASRVPYEVEIGPSRAVQQLAATGVPISGHVGPGQYRRFRVVLAESNRSLAIALRARSGESHLLLGLEPVVTRATSVLRSEAYGDNAIFVPAFGSLNQRHCIGEVLERGKCVYYAAVLGVGDGGDFEISAQAGSGAPLTLGPVQGVELAIPRGGHRYLLIDLTPPLKRMALEVSAWVGSLSGVRVKIASKAKARHPGAELLDAPSDFHAERFAGVWGARLERERTSELCGTVADRSGCVALVVLESKEGFQGQASLSVTAESINTAKPPAARLQAGVPSRAVLRSVGEVAVFGFLVRGVQRDLLVSVTPLTNCSLSLQLEFPAAGNASERLDLPADPRLGFVSARISHADERFRPGLFRFWIRQALAELCEFDVRVEPEADAMKVAPVVLTVDSPTFVSAALERYFIFTSRISEAEDAPSRERLAVKVETLAGDLKVEAAFVSVGASAADPADDSLASALATLRQVEPEDAGGSGGLFVRRGFRENCGAALLCQVLLRVRSGRPERPTDYLVTAVDKLRAEALLPRVPVHGCIGGACPRHRDSKQLYQLYVNNPSTAVRLRISCTGEDRVDACGRVMLSADSRSRLPESLESRAYLPTERSKEGLLEVLVPRRGGISQGERPGQCQVPCVLRVQVELRPGESSDGRAVHFELVAAAESRYSLLLDGNDPVSVTLRPWTSEYFLFDSRQGSPSLTLSATVPYDREDPQADALSMYVLDCGPEAAADSARPSRRKHSFAAHMNPRGQLVVATAGRPAEEAGGIDGHCYYRIAVKSKRRRPVTVALRGFEWHPRMPLPLNQPLQTSLAPGRKTTFELQGSTSGGSVVLGLEVCSGRLRLQAGRVGANGQSPSMTQEGGFDPLAVPLDGSRQVAVEAVGADIGTFILSADDPERRRWLQPDRTQLSAVFGRNGELTLSWDRAWLYDGRHPGQRTGADIEPEVQYEVFYGRVGDTSSNLSTPCGLYAEHERHKMSLVAARARRRATIGGLHPGRSYVFNVVARSTKSSASVAYTPYISHGFSWSGTGSREDRVKALRPAEQGQSSSTSWGRWEALLLVGAAASALVAWMRPICREEAFRQRWELELPSWPRRSARAYQQMQGGYDATPSLLGQSEEPAMAPYQQC